MVPSSLILFATCLIAAVSSAGRGVLEQRSHLTDQCPTNYKCVSDFLCPGKKVKITDGTGLLNLRTKQHSLIKCTGNGFNGVCCNQHILEQCHDTSVCVPQNQCFGTILTSLNSFADYTQQHSWRECKGNGFNGVCCIHNIFDHCPDQSICTTRETCIGTARNLQGSFTEYSFFGSWSQCNLGGGHFDTGICCISDKISSPVVAATACGIRNYLIDLRITSNFPGNEATFGEFPWQGIIFENNTEGVYTFNCGTTFIRNNYAITAAHCIDKIPSFSDVIVRFGEWQLNSNDEQLKYFDVKVSHISIHPEYNPLNVHNDIAILHLSEPIPLQYHINDVCLPGPNTIYEDDECISTGWGRDSFEGELQTILKKISLPFVKHKACENFLRKTRLTSHFILDKSFTCAGGVANEDACYGDGGGPLVCKTITGQYALRGITSWGIGCGTQDVPGVYVDVYYFTQWIENIIGKA